MDYIMGLGNMEAILDIVKLYFISLCTYYMSFKLVNNQEFKKIKEAVMIGISTVIISIICKIMKETFGFLFGIISIVMLVSLVFSVMTKNKFAYSFLIVIVSLTINYVLYFISIFINFILFFILDIRNDYINMCIIILTYFVLIYYFSKIRRFKKGISFLQTKLKDEYFYVLNLNISTMILFTIVILSNFSKEMAKSFGIVLIFFSIIMFITIQKSLKLYYKQKLLIRDLNETKEELEKKKQEVEALEKENLNFSKISHSIAHKQKSLEYKLNELALKNEIASEMDLKDRLKNITKDLQQETTVELDKTNIPEIDDMLSYMQSECNKEKIDFQVQLSGNIHYMVNNYVDKEKLEILLADHIKNAIIAIQYSTNINKSILVKLGMIEGSYSLYIYDSGIEFEVDTLTNLGKKPCTTHADKGGTGMGFMNTFDTLRQYQASMIIHEYGKPCPENFTKMIQIKFDRKNEFRICSYREDEKGDKLIEKKEN